MKKKLLFALLIICALMTALFSTIAETPALIAQTRPALSPESGAATLTSSKSSGRYDLDNYVYRRVSFNGSGALVFQRAPRGKTIPGHRFYDGDWIYVNLYYRENGYAMAYDDGEFGYVDASYIDWNDSGASDDAKDFSDYGYRKVVTNGKGSLVFQKTPRGMFMSGHSFKNGDWIYVNLYWRKDGYAMAYDDGDFGYVDAGYIDWDSGWDDGGSGSADISSGAKDLSDFGYKQVTIKGSGALVFQRAPRGKAIPGYRYYDGDWIYVNLYWLKDGYAVAYENGVYGYVDASYIRW